MSLSALRRLEEHGVTFRSHLDGAMVELTPERAIEIQALLGADISMQLDECLGLPAKREEIERAMQLSLRWGERCKRAFEGRAREGYALFGIAQGGDDTALRQQSARALVAVGFDGYAIGGLGGRRTAGRDAQDRRAKPLRCCHRIDHALSDGRRHAGRPVAGG